MVLQEIAGAIKESLHSTKTVDRGWRNTSSVENFSKQEF